MGNDIYYESQCRATALKCLFWVKLRDISLGARIMQVLRENSLEGGVCWPVAAKEFPGNREMQSSDLSQFILCCSPLNTLSLFQLAFRGFTSSPSVFLSALHALSTASHMKKPPRSVCARRITPGLLQTHHLPPAHVRLAGTAALCGEGTVSRHFVLQHRAGWCPGLSQAPSACTVCSPVGVCCWGSRLRWGEAAVGRGWRGCPYNPELAG